MRNYVDMHLAIAAVCPIISSEGEAGKPPTKIVYDPAATDQQKAAAAAVIAAFDWNALTQDDTDTQNVKTTLQAAVGRNLTLAEASLLLKAIARRVFN